MRGSNPVSCYSPFLRSLRCAAVKQRRVSAYTSSEPLRSQNKPEHETPEPGSIPACGLGGPPPCSCPLRRSPHPPGRSPRFAGDAGVGTSFRMAVCMLWHGATS